MDSHWNRRQFDLFLLVNLVVFLQTEMMIRMKAETMGQPQAMAAGPPLFQPRPKDVKQPARMEMIENEMAKLLKPDQERCSSWV
jgi:hypothetical protein